MHIAHFFPTTSIKPVGGQGHSRGSIRAIRYVPKKLELKLLHTMK
jgi:hypothetical protein